MIWDEASLPEGWKIESLGDIAKIVGGGTPKTSVKGNFSEVEGHPWITPADLTGYKGKSIKGGRRFLTDQGLATSSATYLPAGSVLFSSRAPIGYVAIAEEPVTTNQGFRSFVLDDRIAPDYFYYVLKLLTPEAEHLASGTTFAEISGSKLATLPIAYPPLHQQKAIARLLDLTQAKRSNAISHLSIARREIDRFRQSLLAAATTGRLTATWRDSHTDLHTADLVKSFSNTTSRRKRSIPPPDMSMFHNLPEGWSSVTLGQIIERIEAGKSFAVHGRPATMQEWGVIKVSAMSWGRFLEAENKAVPADKPINPAHEINTGDLLISRANTVDLVGATVLVGKTRPRLLLSDKSLRLVPHSGIHKAWLHYILSSPYIREQFASRATGTSDSMRNLSQEKLLATTLPLPPLEEQEEVAQRVESMMTIADRIQSEIAMAESTTNAVIEATISGALRGDLLVAIGRS